MKLNLKAIVASPITDWISRLALAAFYVRFVYIHSVNFHETGRLSSLFLVVFETMLVCIILARKNAQSVSEDASDWVIGAARTILPGLLLPAAVSHETVVLQLVQAFGICITVAGTLSLNRSIGVVAANRGVKTSGMYRFVRHPLYAGYIFSMAAFLAQNPIAWNACVVALIYGFIIFSVIVEESLLRQDPVYLEYTKKTRWRLLPYIW